MLARIVRRPLLAAVALVLAACGADREAPQGDGPAPLLRPGAEGIDLSHHNGPVDWGRLGTEPLEFVYLKATEGTDHIDTRFQENWQAATRLGWQVGAYHFYLLCRDGAPQAENFIRQVEVRAGTLPPAVDLEHAHNCKARGGREAALTELRVFLGALEAEYGAVPVIYTTPAFHAEWLAGEGFEAHPVWIRSLDGPPELPHAIWQYSMKGKVAGVEGPVDLNRAAD
ncbi:MAG: lysozyme [Hyphomonas sp.]|uniref:GH25 family lysozyme n=1 Tax=Hyphomonas sp. TaxID=87 RepID=UPI0025C18965|nr:GH25 family lysozyme [Hyphomonas sp.]MBA4340058.1 lysozyme [Hyphomonas sp.]